MRSATGVRVPRLDDSLSQKPPREDLRSRRGAGPAAGTRCWRRTEPCPSLCTGSSGPPWGACWQAIGLQPEPLPVRWGGGAEKFGGAPPSLGPAGHGCCRRRTVQPRRISRLIQAVPGFPEIERQRKMRTPWSRTAGRQILLNAPCPRAVPRPRPSVAAGPTLDQARAIWRFSRERLAASSWRAVRTAAPRPRLAGCSPFGQGPPGAAGGRFHGGARFAFIRAIRRYVPSAVLGWPRPRPVNRKRWPSGGQARASLGAPRGGWLGCREGHRCRSSQSRQVRFAQGQRNCPVGAHVALRLNNGSGLHRASPSLAPPVQTYGPSSRGQAAYSRRHISTKVLTRGVGTVAPKCDRPVRPRDRPRRVGEFRSARGGGSLECQPTLLRTPVHVFYI